METYLVPDIPAGQRPEEDYTPSCCSPTQGKMKTSGIKVISGIHMACSLLAIGFGIAACIMGCMYSEVGSPIWSGLMFMAAGILGCFVAKPGTLANMYGLLSVFSLVCAISMLVLMLTALPERESEWSDEYICHKPCDTSEYSSCCEGYWKDTTIVKWNNVAIDLVILVIGVIEIVNSLLAITLSLKNFKWINICDMKKKMVSGHGSATTADQSSMANHTVETSEQLSGMKLCFKPVQNTAIATVTVSALHILLGIISVALGIYAIIVGCVFAHIAIPIWSGILIFSLTGICGLLSASKKGSFIPCFLSLSLLSLVCSINMLCWMAVSVGLEEVCVSQCVDWGCNGSSDDYCYDCPPGCCDTDYVCDDMQNRVVIDYIILAVGILEVILSFGCIALSSSQLSCYRCCRNGYTQPCYCCQPQGNGNYMMVMTPSGQMMMMAIPQAQPMMAMNQPMMVQNTPMTVQLQPNMVMQGQQMVAPAQPVGAQCEAHGQGQLQTGQVQGQQVMVQGQQQPMMIQGQPMMVQNQPMMVQNQPMMVQNQPMIVQNQPMMVQNQPMMVQGQPMMAQGQTMMGNGQPMMAQGQPMTVQGQPMMVQGQPMMAQGQPVVVQGQPMMVQGQPMMVQGRGQPMSVNSQGQPALVQDQRPPVLIQDQEEPALIQEQRPLVVMQDQAEQVHATGQEETQPQFFNDVQHMGQHTMSSTNA